MIGLSGLTSRKPFKRILAFASHTGLQPPITVVVQSRQTAVQVKITPDVASIGVVGLKVTVEQNDGTDWFILGGFEWWDVKAAINSADKFGVFRTYLLGTLQEQTYRIDKLAALVASGKQWSSVHDYNFNGNTYQQLAICGSLRVTVDSFTHTNGVRTGDAALTYAVDLIIDSRRLTAFP